MNTKEHRIEVAYKIIDLMIDGKYDVEIWKDKIFLKLDNYDIHPLQKTIATLPTTKTHLDELNKCNTEQDVLGVFGL